MYFDLSIRRFYGLGVVSRRPGRYDPAGLGQRGIGV